MDRSQACSLVDFRKQGLCLLEAFSDLVDVLICVIDVLVDLCHFFFRLSNLALRESWVLVMLRSLGLVRLWRSHVLMLKIGSERLAIHRIILLRYLLNQSGWWRLMVVLSATVVLIVWWRGCHNSLVLFVVSALPSSLWPWSLDWLLSVRSLSMLLIYLT